MKRSSGLAFAAALVSLGLAGCSTTGPLREGFYEPPAPLPSKVPARVAVVTEGFRQQASTVSPSRMGVVTLERFPEAVAQMLGSIYETVTISSTAAQASGADYLVSIEDYPKAATLSFREQGKTSPVARVSRPAMGWDVDQTFGGYDYFAGGYFTILTAGIVDLFLKSAATDKYNELEAQLSDVSGKALAGLREDVLQADAVMHSPSQKAELAKLETQADAESAANDASAALRDYGAILASVVPGSPAALRVEDKVAAASLRAGDEASAPDHARELMARGKALFEGAKSPEDFLPATVEMERALAVHPAWSSGHYNTGLAEEAAGRWDGAAAHLRIYLKLRPQAPDRSQVEQKIAELSIKAEHAARP